MRGELLKYGLYHCGGWAYDQCHLDAKWIMIEVWVNKSWGATGLCQRHALEAFSNNDSEHHPPVYRQWWKLVDFEAHGSWPS